MRDKSVIKPVKNDNNKEVTTRIVDFCRHVAGQSKITAIAKGDDYNQNNYSQHLILEVMVVIHDFQPRIMSYLKRIKNKTVFIFAVDQWVFERDVDRGLLGEAIASKLVWPYEALIGETYLHKQESELKQRLIIELLENLVINFPELAHSIKIHPKYFLYEVFSNRVRVFPLLNYDLAKLTNCLIKDEKRALEGYNIALKQLEKQQLITQENGYIHINKRFIDRCHVPKLRLLNLAKNAPRTLFTSLFGVVPQLMSIVTQNAEAFLRTQKLNWLRQQDQDFPSIDPQNYVFFPTTEGLVSLSDKIDIKGFAQKLLLKDQNAVVEVERIGGVLNDVYLIDTGHRKVLAKRFKDWSGFKWFPLTLWSFGARSFAVSGQARLAKESAISKVLHGEGFNVPRIFHVSNPERIVFMEYIEGESLGKIIKDYSDADNAEVKEYVLTIIRDVGNSLAKVHQQNIVLGDTKPDNVLVKADGTVYLIDFEQAQRGGDRAWDIAVFLYNSGHYLQPFDSPSKAEGITNAFIDGYLTAGGNIDEVQKAGSTKYTRVFSIFTLPRFMLAISNICKKVKDRNWNS